MASGGSGGHRCCWWWPRQVHKLLCILSLQKRSRSSVNICKGGITLEENTILLDLAILVDWWTGRSGCRHRLNQTPIMMMMPVDVMALLANNRITREKTFADFCRFICWDSSASWPPVPSSKMPFLMGYSKQYFNSQNFINCAFYSG